MATYGQALRTCELAYMRRPGEELDLYLREHQIRERRYGGAIGLRGGHGSGKTHLLGWLAERARSTTRARPTVLYAKADSTRLLDLYRQLVPMEGRERVRELITQAMQNMGREHSGRARITESVKERIDDPADFARLFKEGILDREQLFHMLRERLEEAYIPREIPLTLLAVDSPTIGERAFAWFRGDEVGDVPELGLPHPLTSLRAVGEVSADPDVASINALEALAALHHLADVPLVIFLDQFEVLLRADAQRQQTLFSVIKKLVEQVGGQNALLFIAGNDESWQLLTRDVSPRLRLREPLPVGNLSEIETPKVLESRTERDAAFPETAVKLIHQLSGGNIRETLQIAHYAFEATGGVLGKVTEDVLLRSADSSGTVADQHRLALELADPVLAQHAGATGQVVNDVAVAPGVMIDRLLYLAGTPVVALVVVRATDKLSEVDSARRFKTTRAYLAEHFPRTQMVVAAVGYSSEEIRRLLGSTGSIVTFNEATFQGLLRAETVSLIARFEAAGGAVGGADPAVLKLLTELSSRIDQIGVRRQKEEEEAQERLVTSTYALAGAAREEREIRTRWEMLDELDALQAALAAGQYDVERQRIRAMLVANETAIQDKLFDQLGGIYLEIVSLVPLVRSDDWRQSADNVRGTLVAELRRIARGKRLRDRWLNAPVQTWFVVGGAISVAYLALRFMDAPWLVREFGDYPLTVLTRLALPTLAAGVVTGAGSWIITVMFRAWRIRWWERALRNLRNRLEIARSAEPRPT